MQILIDIPDEEYENVKKAGGCYYDFGKAIFYGTPLPKGHGRLKDVDALGVRTGTIDDWEIRDFVYLAEIEQAPTIIEADKAESEAEK